jgi:DNA-binding NarL/FixJ family response regulator
MDGLEASKRITALMPSMRIILLTLHAELFETAKLAQFGISAFVSKQQAGTELVPAVCVLLGLACAAGAA